MTAQNIYSKLRKSAQNKGDLGMTQPTSGTIFDDYKQGNLIRKGTGFHISQFEKTGN